uniref:Uncharacterized protein n=1 Tax=Solanum lycopersicum TaxID=4081 RepID=A0A3Q7E7H1_SOLLC
MHQNLACSLSTIHTIRSGPSPPRYGLLGQRPLFLQPRMCYDPKQTLEVAQVGLSLVRSNKYVSLRSTPAPVHPPETTNFEPSIVQELCQHLGRGGAPPDTSFHVGCLASKSRTNTSLSNPCLPHPPNTTNQEPLRHERVWPQRPGGDDLTLTRRHSGLAASRLRTNVSSIGCILTPSPPNNTSLFPAAHALKLQREGSTAPLTVSFFQQTASRVKQQQDPPKDAAFERVDL